MLDHRLVQTAVIGHKSSDHPVILPMDAWELDRWRGAHPGYSYWCGLQLGGCGGELSDRRYTTKVCHFAHHPTAPVCHRKNNGESSADHLFIKRGVQRLLGKRKVKGRVETHDLGTGPGDAVDVYLPDGRRRLRFQLSAVDYRAWRRADDELAADADGIDWIFSSEGPITQQFVGRHGYCLRVRCETVGGERRVHIGAEARDRTVSWTPLEDCAVTPSGIVTPDIERILLTRPRPRPTAFPLQGGLAFALAPETDVPADSPFAAKDRHLLVADVKPVDSPIVRALVSLPGDTEVPPAEHVYRVADGARLLIAEGTVGWAVEARRYTRLNAHDAQRTGLWTPPTSQASTVPARRVSELRKTGSDRAPLAIYAPVAGSTAGRDPLTKAELVTALRDALAHHARLRCTTTWEALTRTALPELAKYSIADRQALLVEVDSPLREHVPVFSALLRENGEPLPYLSQVLSRLGVLYAGVSTHLGRWVAVETERAFAAHGTPSKAMPPRLSLVPEGSAAQRRAASVDQAQRASESRGPETPVAPNATMERVLGLVAQLDKLELQLSEFPRKQARKACRQARAWLALRDGRRLSPSERKRFTMEAPENPVVRLENALGVAEDDIRMTAWLEKYENGQRTANKTQPKPPSAKVQADTEDPVDRLARQLVTVAARGATIAALLLDGGRVKPDFPQRLTAVDSKAKPMDPLLSALVIGPSGGPVPFFGDILRTVGLAVPQTDEALLKIWRREQERAYAAHGNPRRPLPPRLVPTVSQATSSGT
ncbi:hypothetical protein [Streptomyces hirsutus]|uniref:hypothetical protein n=1 Tax=Streptomyces hirsutus TaxID=35620 RepID=UPI00339F05A4